MPKNTTPRTHRCPTWPTARCSFFLFFFSLLFRHSYPFIQTDLYLKKPRHLFTRILPLQSAKDMGEHVTKKMEMKSRNAIPMYMQETKQKHFVHVFHLVHHPAPPGSTPPQDHTWRPKDTLIERCALQLIPSSNLFLQSLGSSKTTHTAAASSSYEQRSREASKRRHNPSSAHCYQQQI